MNETKISKKISLSLILNRIFGIFFLLIGIISIFSEPIPWIIMLLIASILIPPIIKEIYKKIKFRFSVGIKLIIIFIGFIIIWITTNTTPTQQMLPEQQKDITIIFDLEALYGKNIDEIRAILGEPIDGKYTNPTQQQLELGTKEWNNSFKKNQYELLVTYDVTSKKVIDFFIGTDDPSGGTKDTKELEKILNIENSTNFTIEQVKAIKDPSIYTGIKVIPKKL